MSYSISDLTSVVSAVVSVVSLFIAISARRQTRREKTPFLRSKLSYGYMPNLDVLLLEVQNPGEKIVHVTGVSLKWDSRTIIDPFIQGERSLPFDLAPGKRALFWMPIEKIRHTVRDAGVVSGSIKLAAAFRDALDAEYLSELKTFEVK